MTLTRTGHISQILWHLSSEYIINLGIFLCFFIEGMLILPVPRFLYANILIQFDMRYGSEILLEYNT